MQYAALDGTQSFSSTLSAFFSNKSEWKGEVESMLARYKDLERDMAHVTRQKEELARVCGA